MLRKLLNDAEKHDEKAMVELIERFSPLFKKYALKLGYEDAYEDIILWFIELVKSGKLASLQEKVIVLVLEQTMKSYYQILLYPFKWEILHYQYQYYRKVIASFLFVLVRMIYFRMILRLKWEFLLSSHTKWNWMIKTSLIWRELEY